MSLALPTLDDFRMAVDAWVQTPGRGEKPVAYLGHADYMTLLSACRQGQADFVDDPDAPQGKRWTIMGVPLFKVNADRHFNITNHP